VSTYKGKINAKNQSTTIIFICSLLIEIKILKIFQNVDVIEAVVDPGLEQLRESGGL